MMARPREVDEDNECGVIGEDLMRLPCWNDSAHAELYENLAKSYVLTGVLELLHET